MKVELKTKSDKQSNQKSRIKANSDDSNAQKLLALKSARSAKKRKHDAESESKGNLKIGDDWNAITIIAFSQSNPLKAIAEFVENSIDAKATKISITRGKEGGDLFLRIVDNGTGIPCDENGVPNFKYVATHICDSIKRQLKVTGPSGRKGIQGEFGIGLLSFWTVGETLTLRSTSETGKLYQMTMKKGDRKYQVSPCRSLINHVGTELTIKPLLPGLRQFSCEKLQWFLASELRNRILESGVEVRVIDRLSRSEYRVEPRRFSGRKLTISDLPEFKKLGISWEVFLEEAAEQNQIGLYRNGTRVLPSLTELDEFKTGPWSHKCLQGLIDAPCLTLSPGTRLGVIRDDFFEQFVLALKSAESFLEHELSAQQKAEEEKVSYNTLITIQKAFKDAILGLPPEEYDWFSIHEKQQHSKSSSISLGAQTDEPEETGVDQDSERRVYEEKSEIVINEEKPSSPEQKAFFDFPGPLSSVRISPQSSIVQVSQKRFFRAIALDKKRKAVHQDLTFNWEIVEGTGTLNGIDQEITEFIAGSEPAMAKIRVQVSQKDLQFKSDALITVADLLYTKKEEDHFHRGMPGYTYRRAPGESWRSRYDNVQNLVEINNAHRDFVYASQNNALKMRYLCRLFSKEMVLANFPGLSTGDTLERLIEVSLRVEECLK